MRNTFEVTNPKSTNWKKGAKIRLVSKWFGDTAAFSNAIGEGGPVIWADRSEVTEIIED